MASAFLFDVWLAEFVVLVCWFNFDVVVLFYFYIFYIFSLVFVIYWLWLLSRLFVFVVAFVTAS